MARKFALDVSNVNPATEAQVRASRCAVLICKATQAADFRDTTLAGHRKIAATLELPFGSYLFLDPTVDGGKQADYYLAYAKPRKDEPLIIDAETMRAGQSFATVAAVADACARRLEAKGHKPILYASASFWQSLEAAHHDLRRLPIWEADYPGRFTRWLPRLARLRLRLGHGATVLLWQWTDRATVAGHGFDESLLLCSVKRLRG